MHTQAQCTHTCKHALQERTCPGTCMPRRCTLGAAVRSVCGDVAMSGGPCGTHSVRGAPAVLGCSERGGAMSMVAVVVMAGGWCWWWDGIMHTRTPLCVRACVHVSVCLCVCVCTCARVRALMHEQNNTAIYSQMCRRRRRRAQYHVLQHRQTHCTHGDPRPGRDTDTCKETHEQCTNRSAHSLTHSLTHSHTYTREPIPARRCECCTAERHGSHPTSTAIGNATCDNQLG